MLCLQRYGLQQAAFYLPVFSLFETPWIGHYIPGNLVEKILVNAFFPGAAGAIAAEILYSNIHGQFLVEETIIWLGLAVHCFRRLLGRCFSFGETCKTSLVHGAATSLSTPGLSAQFPAGFTFNLYP